MMTNGLDLRQLNILEEESFGPPPRFLVERRPGDRRDDCQAAMQDEDSLPALRKLKALLGIF
ncbi:MAG: hypothetical protein HC850_11740 [Rhodomicrobium sp.]|nr:hypothetical protein [Rhodomicrobium sp.]